MLHVEDAWQRFGRCVINVPPKLGNLCVDNIMQLKSRYLAVVCFILVVKTHNFSSPNFWNGSTEVNHLSRAVFWGHNILFSLFSAIDGATHVEETQNSACSGTVTPVYLEASREVRVSINGGTPKSFTLIGFSLINHPFWGTPIYGNPQVCSYNTSLSFGV